MESQGIGVNGTEIERCQVLVSSERQLELEIEPRAGVLVDEHEYPARWRGFLLPGAQRAELLDRVA
jgi:hypothetical protein